MVSIKGFWNTINENTMLVIALLVYSDLIDSGF